ncbi:PIG-L deacetylase family protein [Tessaracoccus oleiagri]|uniref:N-acetylglucosaminyl deacetylase, LmbE family n=1 Tax=Tessaracoccus oleiagri TaxID=686624 RepID=A0A1G9MWR0_9ACTN|nr:PIG-L deacetylase family protein [Tessaracoccus oleiagri]SDL78700.1 N-acetylglucosaminyl deacetylase, LmbE family [Tessaracoccus oleiagri]
MAKTLERTIGAATRVLTVVAHPDDESFGLGAVIHEFTKRGAEVDVLCLTHGEASTLGARPDLGRVREAELRRAGERLGVREVELADFPDGALEAIDPLELEARIQASVMRVAPDLILVFDPRSGVTGHPDHRMASEVALKVAATHGIRVLGWALPKAVTEVLEDEFGAQLCGYPADELHYALEVVREAQLRAIDAHASQAVPGSMLWRRLELMGDREYLRELAGADALMPA